MNIVSTESEEDTVLLSDAVAEDVIRYDLHFLNDMFGGGLPNSSTSLIGGKPGAGKTTLFLQICDMLIEQLNKEVLYVANEQKANEIAVTATRIKVKHLNKIRIVKAMGGLKRSLNDMVEQYNPCAFIVDSLSKLAMDDLMEQVKLAILIKEFCSIRNIPGLLVSQVNKDGDLAGLQKLQHEVDATFYIHYDKDDVSGTRYFQVMKNRFGQAPLAMKMMMTPKDSEVPGMLIPIEDDDDDD